MTENPNSEQLQSELIKLKQHLEIFTLNKAKGAQVRSRIKYIEEGEKNSNYFLGIEKSKGAQNTIKEIKDNNNTIFDPLRILSHIETFYNTLYEKDSKVDESLDSMFNFTKNITFNKLTAEDYTICDVNITLKELGSALFKMNADSAPGSDGLTTPFYKFFWPKIKYYIFNSFNDALEKGELSKSQTRGIITLSHKGGDRNNLSNWRPISLLNTDYKIFSKLVAIRIQKVMDYLINPLQKGFLKGRNISELIRLIDDSLFAARESNSPGLLASIDFQKAFDSINKASIINSLKIFNFGPQFTQMVSVLINGSESCVRNGNWHSSWFPCDRGVRQGCCLSPYLFLLVVEFLSIRLHHSKEIKGVSINKFETKLSKAVQYADDLSLFLKDESELEFAFSVIEDFGKISGLKLNKKKSIILPFGGYKRKENSITNVTWLNANDYIKILGIFFSGETEASKIDLNWKTKIESITRTISKWKSRDISIYGKIILCKTFLLSKINYVMQSLVLPDHVLNEIDTIMFKYIWQKRLSNKKVFEKVKRKTLCLDFNQGGLKMISTKDQQQVFCIKWISKVAKESNSANANLANSFFSKIGGIPYVIKSCLANPHLIFDSHIKSYFWKKAASAWSKIHFNMSPKISCIKTILSQPIFLNSNIKYKNNPLIFPTWIEKNVLFLCDIIDQQSLKNKNDILQNVGNYAGFIFDHNALINSLPKEWIANICKMSCGELSQIIQRKWEITELQNKIINMKNFELRKRIMDTQTITKCNENLWKRILDADVSCYYEVAIKSCKESRLRLLHFKILHNIYPTNILLHKMKIKTSNLCEHCLVPDYIDHFFCDCALVCDFWKHVLNYIRSKINIDISLSKKDLLLGLLYADHDNIERRLIKYINHIILIAKLCISKFRYGKINNIYLIFDTEIFLRKIENTWYT